jgi:hypothetical protein
MRAQLPDGRVFRISFRHYRHTGEGFDTKLYFYVETNLSRIEEQLNTRFGRIDGATECWLYPEGEQRPEAAQGVSAQSVLDVWDVEVGRRVALKRALDVVFPRKGAQDVVALANRRAVWDAYFSRGTEQVRAEQV